MKTATTVKCQIFLEIPNEESAISLESNRLENHFDGIRTGDEITLQKAIDITRVKLDPIGSSSENKLTNSI